MLAALVGPALVFVTGIAVPAGILMSPDLMGYQRMAGFAHAWPGKIIILAVIVLFLWHAALRIFHMLHDFGVHAGVAAFYKMTPDEPLPSTLDYLVASAAG